MIKSELHIQGMHCASCAQNITIALNKNEHIQNADTNFATKKAIFEYDEKNIDLNKIKKIVRSVGYGIDEGTEKKDSNKENNKTRNKAIIAILLSLPMLIRMFWMWNVPGDFLNISLTSWLQFILTTYVVFFLGTQFHVNALKALKRKQTDMDTLISLGTLAAYFFSVYAMTQGEHLYFESAATITALILLGRYLEDKTKNKASKAMEKLLEISAKAATVINPDGSKQERSIEDINIGEIIQIRTSEKVPLDGTVKSGAASIDEAMLSGEPLPQNKGVGDHVFAGTLIQNGTIEVEVLKDGQSTLLASIIKTVEDAQNYKAPTQRLADKISSIFVPVVVALSLITFAAWWLIGGEAGTALINAVAVLVISCPCALGIATPIAILVGSSVGAQRGILIKNGESFEKAKNIDVLLLDKTGTITEGKPQVEKVVVNENIKTSLNQVLKVADSLALNSTHPLSKAIVKYAKKQNIESVAMNNYQEIPGEGIVANCEKHNIKIGFGNSKLLKRMKIKSNWAQNREQNGNGTINYVVHNQDIIGSILITDSLRPSSLKAIEASQNINIEPIIVSGDTEDNVKSMAQKIGVKKFFAGVLPGEKQNKVKELQSSGKNVAFAGDGINDAPALAQADIGIAMASGTDIAKEAGDLIILHNDPVRIVDAIKLSQKTFKTIKQNLFWAFFYNALAIPLAMFGIVNPMIAAVAMGFSDITVIGNSLRIYRK